MAKYTDLPSEVRQDILRYCYDPNDLVTTEEEETFKVDYSDILKTETYLSLDDVNALNELHGVRDICLASRLFAADFLDVLRLLKTQTERAGTPYMLRSPSVLIRALKKVLEGPMDA